jgi:hypothetical protein
VQSGQRIRKRWRKFGSEGKDPTEIFGYYPDKARWTVFIAPEIIIPLVFAGAWVYIFSIVPPDLSRTAPNEVVQTNNSPISVISPLQFTGTNQTSTGAF